MTPQGLQRIMIRPNKPVKLLEWGLGTNTTNQVWAEIGEGTIVSAKRSGGVMNMVVELKGQLNKKNSESDYIKVAQMGEGMTPYAERWGKIKSRWGEVAMGKLKSVESAGSKSRVHIEIDAATKVGKTVDV